MRNEQNSPASQPLRSKAHRTMTCAAKGCSRTFSVPVEDALFPHLCFCPACLIYEYETARRIGYQFGRQGDETGARKGVWQMANSAVEWFWIGYEEGLEARRAKSRRWAA